MTHDKIKLDHITQTQMRLGKIVSFFVNSWFSVPNLIDRIDRVSNVSVMFENDNEWDIERKRHMRNSIVSPLIG